MPIKTDLPGPNEKFASVDDLHDRLIINEFLSTGYSMHIHTTSTKTRVAFRCGYTDPSGQRKCSLYVKATRGREGEPWQVEQNDEAVHSHGKHPKAVKNPRWLPSNAGRVLEVMPVYWEKLDKEVKATTPSENGRPHRQARDKKLYVDPEWSPEPSPEPGPVVEPGCKPVINANNVERAQEEILFLDDDTGDVFVAKRVKREPDDDSLEAFLKSIKTAFPLDGFAPILRDNEHGIKCKTKTQLLELAGLDLDALISHLPTKKLGLSPVKAFKQGLEAALGAEHRWRCCYKLSTFGTRFPLGEVVNALRGDDFGCSTPEQELEFARTKYPAMVKRMKELVPMCPAEAFARGFKAKM
ncbi:hypothetical protein JCM10212_002248 [Sporobolomyces blumeae]